VILAAALLFHAGPVAGQDGDPGKPEGPGTDPSAPPELPKLDSPSAIQRELDLVQRDLEELIVRIGDKDPSSAQREKLHQYLVRLSDLRSQLKVAQAEVDSKMEAAGNSVKGKWLAVRKALDDFTYYDVKDGMFRIRLGLRLQFDGTTGWESDGIKATAGDLEATFKFRRARFFADGRLFRRMDFKFEYDFAADAGLKDAFLEGAKFTKYFKWRIGHFKEPVSLARHTSANDNGFLEWALPVQALAPGRNLGLMFRHAEGSDRWTWAVSATTNGQTTDDNRTEAKLSLAARMTGLPIYRKNGGRLLHLGASYKAAAPRGGETSVSARPEARFAPFFITTGSLDVDRTTLYGLEAATVQGPFWVQAEWLTTDYESDEFGDARLGGGYVEAGWFATGESRYYFAQEGVFGRTRPNRPFRGGNPFRKDSNGGAIEFVARVSSLDLNDGYVTGGEMRDFSVGVNWYHSQTSRLMANYIYSKVEGVGHANILLLRYQFNP
jgi:phosphate-selective porin OprO/OprP